MKNKINTKIVVIVLFFLIVISSFIYANISLDRTQKLKYQIGLSHNSVQNLKKVTSDEFSLSIAFFEIKNSLNAISPLYQIKSYRMLNYILEISETDKKNLKSEDVKLLFSYVKYLNTKKFYSSKSLSYKVEITVFFIQVIVFVLVFYTLYKWIPKLLKNSDLKRIVLSLFILLNIFSFVFYQMNNSIENEIKKEIKSNYK